MMPTGSTFGSMPAGGPLVGALPVHTSGAFPGLLPADLGTSVGAVTLGRAATLPVGVSPKKELLSRLREMQQGWMATQQYFLEQQACSPWGGSTATPCSQSGASPSPAGEVAYAPSPCEWRDRFIPPPVTLASASKNRGVYCPGELLAKSAELRAPEEGSEERSDCSTADTLDAAATGAAAREGAAVAVDLPSAGSAMHASGECKPCAFIFTKGCSSGLECKFCHLCDPGERRRRQKEKRAFYSSLRQTRKASE